MSCTVLDSGKQILYPDNDNIVTFGPVTSGDGEYVNDADLTMTLKDADDANVTNAVDLAVDYIADSLGRYRGTLPSTLALTAGAEYTLIITGDVSGDDETDLRIPCVALTRTT